MKPQKSWQLVLSILVLLFMAQPVQSAGYNSAQTKSTEIQDASSVIYVPGSSNISLQTAIDTVPDNGIVQISAGTYYAPAAGYIINSLTKSFTLQAAPNETVILSGHKINRIFDIGNSPSAHIIFKNIIFEDGYNSGQEAAGVSIARTNVTFLNCEFRGNHKTVYRTNIYGGSLFIEAASTVFIINSIFHSNISEDGGAGFATRESTVYVHNSRFFNNLNFSNNYDAVPIGTGANIVNSKVRITNSQFRDNQSYGHGAAIYIIGLWNHPTGSDVVISNSTFENNHIIRNFPAKEPESGGGINIEDNASLKVYNSRFINNSAWMGGGINVFRAKAEIYDSIFIGNRATETTANSGFGGTILFNYFDRPDFARLLIEDTYIQGRYSGVTTVAQYGGGIHAHGNPTTNKPPLTLRRVILNDLDTTTTANKGTLGAGLEISGVNFTMEDSTVMNCDARGPLGGIGGGMIVYADTNVNILRSTFAYNSADSYGGAISILGSQLNINESLFLGNVLSPGVTEDQRFSYGAAIFSSPDFYSNKSMTGSVANSTFVSNNGIAIYDDDKSPAPINALTYNNNSFFETTYTDKVYNNRLASPQTVAGLNSLVIFRSGSSTDKSPQSNNRSLSSAPTVAKLLAAPHQILPVSAAGDSSPTTYSYLGYVWNGTTATLDGIPLTNMAGEQLTTATGQHTLSVDNQMNANANVANGVAPILSTMLVAGSPNPSIQWNVEAGSFLSIQANQGLSLPNTSSGSVTVPSSDRIYSIYLMTKEGGVVNFVDPRMPQLYAPDKITVLAGLNQPIRRGEVPIHNVGGLTLYWEASTCTSSLIQIETTSGSITDHGTIPFLIKPDQVGTYIAEMQIDASLAGSANVTIEIILAEQLYQNHLPVVLR